MHRRRDARRLAGLHIDAAIGDPAGITYREIPIAIQDRAFRDDGSLFYPDSRAYFDGITGPYVGNADDPTDVSPIWNPEFFGNTMMVNGSTWPFLDVEQRRYRLRLLNGCNARTLLLQLDYNLPFWQIGSDGGYLPRPVKLVMRLASRIMTAVAYRV